MNPGNKHYFNNYFELEKVKGYIYGNPTEKPNTDINIGEEDDEEYIAQ